MRKSREELENEALVKGAKDGCRPEKRAGFAFEKAMPFFKQQNYTAFVTLLNPYETYLSPSQKARLKFAHKQLPTGSEHLNMSKGEALRRAVEFAEHDNIRTLVEEGADVNAVDESGESLLTRALGTCEIDIAELLIQLGAQYKVSSDVPYTPLEAAIAGGAGHLVEMMVENGVNVNQKGKEATGNPIHMLPEVFLDPCIFQMFVDAGADLTALNEDGETAAQMAEENLEINTDDKETLLEIVRILTPKGV